jgi:hypothetical protein
MSENVGASTSRNSEGLFGLYRDNFTFTVEFKKKSTPPEDIRKNVHKWRITTSGL